MIKGKIIRTGGEWGEEQMVAPAQEISGHGRKVETQKM